MSEIEVLDEQVLYQKGPLKRIRRYLRGKHPERGLLTRGLTGWETIEERDIIVPMTIFQVIDLIPSSVEFTEIVEGGTHGEGI